MATTKNHKIVKTLRKAIEYAMNDKVEDELKDDIKSSVAYVMNDKTGEVIYPTICSTLNCIGEHPYDTFKMLINEYGKDEITNGNRRTKNGETVLAWHFHQNFEGHIDPIIANEIGHKLAEEMFGNFPVVIGTHTNTENTHNHIIVCAWNLEGKKWHQHNAAYQKLRTVSDRLCDEYGLSVLEKTRKQKLIKFKDKNGNLHYYEPTERKNKLLKQRDSEGNNNYDVGSYHNTMAYEFSENKTETMREIIRQDIDKLLPMAKSYEHLLELLRQLGYKIKDKKNNGEWLKHVSFQPPTGSKGIRDNKLSDDGFYIRENLENIIAEFAKDKVNLTKDTFNDFEDTPEYFEEYVYGITDISKINEESRRVKSGEIYNTVKRGELEKEVIIDLKYNDLKLIDTSVIDRLIKEKNQNKANSFKQKNEVIIKQIKQSFKALSFMENESVFTQEQILAITSVIWDKYSMCLENLDNLDLMLKKLEKLIDIPDNIKAIENRIEKMKDKPDYVENELPGDMQQLSKYYNLVKKYKLDLPEEYQRLKSQITNFRMKSVEIQVSMSKYKNILSNYENCISVLTRIEREKGNIDFSLFKDYEEIKERGKKATEEFEKKKEKRKAAER